MKDPTNFILKLIVTVVIAAALSGAMQATHAKFASADFEAPSAFNIHR